MIRKDPNSARQKFYTTQLTGGCSMVAFYNHTGNEFVASDVTRMVEVARENFSNLPPSTTKRNGKECQLALFVWIDMADDHVFIGHALTADQAAIGCVKFDSGSEREKVCEYLKIFARTYWAGLDNSV